MITFYENRCKRRINAIAFVDSLLCYLSVFSTRHTGDGFADLTLMRWDKLCYVSGHSSVITDHFSVRSTWYHIIFFSAYCYIAMGYNFDL